MALRTALSVLTVLCVLLAGCGGGAGPTETPTDGPSASPSPTTTGPTTTSATPGEGGYFKRYEFSARPVSETGVAREVALTREDVERGVVWREQPFVRALFTNRSATRIAIDEPDPGRVPGPFENGTVVRDNGSYFRLNKTVVAEHEGPAYRMHLEGPIRERSDETYEEATQEAVDYAALSPADRRLFGFAVPAPEEREHGGSSASYRWVFPPDADPADSRLVDGDGHYVRHRGDYFLVQAVRPQGRAVRYRVRYELAPVATSASEFAEEHLETLVTPITEERIDPPARGVILDTIRTSSGAWEGETDVPERYRSAGSWIHDHPPDGHTAYVRYDGSLYRIRLSVVVE